MSSSAKAALERVRWLARRAGRALKRPAPLVIRAVNAMSVSTGPAHAARILRNALADHVHVVLAVECGDLDVRQVVDQRVWRVFQFGRNNPDERAKVTLSGCAILVRRGRLRVPEGSVHLNLGSKATSEGKWKTGHGIGARYILRIKSIVDHGTPWVWRTSFGVGHAPPDRAPRARARFMAVFRALRVQVTAADFNLRGRAVARLTGRKVRSVGLLAITVPWWIPASEAVGIDVDGDHLAVEVTLWPHRKEKHR